MSKKLNVRAWQYFKGRQKQTGHQIDMTYEEWIFWWQNTGHLHERGIGKEKYCMSLVDVKLPYSINNIECITNRQREAKNNVRKGRALVNDLGVMYSSAIDCYKATGVSVWKIKNNCKKNKNGWRYL